MMGAKPMTLGHLLDHYQEMSRLHNESFRDRLLDKQTRDTALGASTAYRGAADELRRILTGENMVGEKVEPSLIERIVSEGGSLVEAEDRLKQELEPRD